MKKGLLIMLLVTILLLGIPATYVNAAYVDVPDGYFHTHPSYTYVGPWVWDTSYGKPSRYFWRGPDGTVCLIDMRSIPEMQRGDTEGVIPGLGLFITATPLTDPRYTLLGDNWADLYNPLSIRIIENKYDIKFSVSYTLGGMVWEMFAEKGDPTGMTRWLPLLVSTDGAVHITLKGFSDVSFYKDPPRTQRQERRDNLRLIIKAIIERIKEHRR